MPETPLRLLLGSSPHKELMSPAFLYSGVSEEFLSLSSSMAAYGIRFLLLCSSISFARIQNPQEARILFVSSTVLSHLEGSFDLALQLKQRGYKSIAYALPNDDNLRRKVAGYGFTFLPLGPNSDVRLKETFARISQSTSVPEQAYLFGVISNELLANHSRPFDKVLDDGSFDLVVADYFAPVDAVAAAKKHGVPLVEFLTAAPLDDPLLAGAQLEGSLDFSTSFAKRLRLTCRFIASVVETLAIMAYHGVEFNHLLMQRSAQPHAIHFAFAGFRYPSDVRFPATTVAIGFSCDRNDPKDGVDPKDVELETWLDESSAVVYVSFGVLVRPRHKDLMAIIEGVLSVNEKIRVLMSNPEKNSILSMLNGQKSVRVETWVHQPMVLSHSSTIAFISHGGPRSLAEAMSSHVPLLVIPHYGDQFIHAFLVEIHELGMHLLKTDITVETVHNQMETILARRSEMQSNLAEMDRLRALSGGPSRGADLIELILIAKEERVIPYNSFLRFVKEKKIDVVNFFLFIIFCLGFWLIRTWSRRGKQSFNKSEKSKGE
eukprot:m.10773 g.10773  ORF g.10773 m.10773 type:complete len:547 (+) comp22650_c0_seq1:24-1664(+)